MCHSCVHMPDWAGASALSKSISLASRSSSAGTSEANQARGKWRPLSLVRSHTTRVGPSALGVPVGHIHTYVRKRFPSNGKERRAR